MAHTSNELLSEEHLKQISRSIRSYVPTDATEDSLDRHEERLKDLRALLDGVFFTSASTGLSASHRVAAWNTLCSLIDQVLATNIPGGAALFDDDDVFERAFRLYLSHAHSARPKSSRQLLNTLVKCLQKRPDDDASKRMSIEELVRALLDYDSPHTAKASMQLLGQLLLKDIIHMNQVLDMLRQLQSEDLAEGRSDISRKNDMPYNYSTDTDLETLLTITLRWLGRGDHGSTVAQFVSTVLDKAESLGDDTSQPMWARPLENAVQLLNVNSNDLRAHVLPALFKRDIGGFVTFLRAQGLDALLSEESRCGSINETLLFSALQTGKEMGLLEEAQDHKSVSTGSSLSIPLRVVEALLLRSTRAARLTGLSFLITSHFATRPFSPQALQLIRKSLVVCFADVDADFRGEVFSAFQKLVDRIRAITAVLAKQDAAVGRSSSNQESRQETTPTNPLKLHKDFLEWLTRFLGRELRPTASYQRHISALKCLLILVRSGLDKSIPAQYHSKSAIGDTKWPFHIQLMTAGLRRLLLDSTLDSFDDVRQTASSILDLYCSDSPADADKLPEAVLNQALERAQTSMFTTGRADHADGVAHLYSLSYRRYGPESPKLDRSRAPSSFVIDNLIKELESTLVIAFRDLGQAAKCYPMHGLLISLRYILTQGSIRAHDELRQRLFEYVQRVWEIVKPGLCNDAPEGYVPDEFENDPEIARGALSYCWRALKEASLLLSTLIMQQDLGKGFSQDKLVTAMSNLCFTQLAQLRHRGAFSTVAQTWITCCMHCQAVSLPDGRKLLDFWYDNALDMLRSNATINTRRSAGLPSLLCGILIADKTGLLFDRALADLEEIARQPVDTVAAEEGSLAQVHAMNCLKDMLKNARLGKQSEGIVPHALRLTADALQSDVWAIRNCGLMLFRAVIDRLLGTDQSHFDEHNALQKRISYEQHPELFDVILGLLPRQLSDGLLARYEGVFPAMQLLQYMRIPRERYREAETAVQRLLGSTSWHVREKAARTMSTFIIAGPVRTKGEDWKSTAEASIAKLHNQFLPGQSTSENHVHGSVLTARYTLKYLAANVRNSAAAKGILQDLVRLVEACRKLARSPITSAACIDLARHSWAFMTAMSTAERMPENQEALLRACTNGLNENASALAMLESLVLDSLEAARTAVERQAVARLVAQQMLVDGTLKEADVEACVRLLTRLASTDENAAEHFLRALVATRLETSELARTVISRLTNDLLESDAGTELKIEAQQILLQLLAQHDKSSSSASDGLLPSNSLLHPSSIFRSKKCNQRFADQSLSLRAVRLENFARISTPVEDGVADHIANWATDTAEAITGNSIYTREAAADAISRISSLWRILSSNDRLDSRYQHLCVAVYDLLNDDEEDIRLLASKISRQILSCNNHARQPEYEPITTSQKLLAYCVRRWAQSHTFATIALERAFGLSRGVISAVAEDLMALSSQETALFGEEKQNLYIDDATEVRAWSQVMQKMSPAATAQQDLDLLATWVLEGLSTLKSHAEAHEDGPLGWTTRPKVFTLGLKVIYGAETLFVLSNKGCRLPAPPSQLRLALFECQVAFEASAVNDLWCQEVDRILADSVSSKLGLINMTTNTIGNGKWGIR